MREDRVISLRGDNPDDVVVPVNVPTQPLVDDEKLLAAVRRIYMLCYRDVTGNVEYGRKPIPAYDGGEDAFGRTHRPIWPKVLAAIIAAGADPMSFIKAQFALCTHSRPPRVQHLLSELAAGTWEQYRLQLEDQLARRLTAGIAAIGAAANPYIYGLGWEQSRAIRYCLNSTCMVNLTPLFRYCYGIQSGFPEVAARFREEALIEYVFQQTAYDAKWGPFVPADLKSAANALRASLLCQR